MIIYHFLFWVLSSCAHSLSLLYAACRVLSSCVGLNEEEGRERVGRREKEMRQGGRKGGGE